MVWHLQKCEYTDNRKFGGVSVTVLLDQRTLQNREQSVKRKLIFVFTNLEVSRKNTSFLLDYTLF